MKKVLSLILSVLLVLCLAPLQTYAAGVDDVINSADLCPLRTGYEPLDSLVDDIFDEIFTDGMTTAEKVRACYDYVIVDSSYGIGTMYNDVWMLMDEYGYRSEYDAFIIAYGYSFLRQKRGVCNDYASAFVVLTRALGLESYLMSGQTNTTAGGYSGHMWVNIRIKGSLYTFDPQVECNIANRNGGKIGYYRYCATDAAMEGRLIYADREGDIGCFRYFATRTTDGAIGDVNLDGRISSLDAACILRHDAGLVPLGEEALALADINGDGRVSSLDAALVLKYDAGLIKELY